MKLTLAENIRAFRKERRLTQEQLAEVLGVTTGAVHKWESGMSVPELNLIVDLADFFDTSVDVLLGYRMKDNRLESTGERLAGYCRSRDPEGLIEAEKALKKYPNSFRIVLGCANLYLVFGIGSRDKSEARRALELLEQARLLISQNTDPEISELTIYGGMASAYMLLGEYETGIELLKKHNVCDIFCDSIGIGQALFLKRYEDAEPFLSEALLHGVACMLNAAAGYALVFCSRGDYPSAQDILLWGIKSFLSLKKDERTSDSTDLSYAELLVLLAYAQWKDCKADDARDSMRLAAETARRFDAAPDYGVEALRFAAVPETASFSSIFGATAAESIEKIIQLLEDQALSGLWKEVSGRE